MHGDASTIVLCIAFATLYVAFFVVFPGIRKEVSVKTADPYCAYSFMGRAIMLISSIMGLLREGIDPTVLSHSSPLGCGRS